MRSTSTDLNETINTTTYLDNLLNSSINTKSCHKSINQLSSNKNKTKQKVLTKNVYDKNPQSLRILAINISGKIFERLKYLIKPIFRENL